MVGGRRSERAAKEERIRDDMMGVVRRVGPSIRQLTDFFASVEKIVTAIVLADAGDEDGWMAGLTDVWVGGFSRSSRGRWQVCREGDPARTRPKCWIW